VGLSGTGGGFKKFCNGETDITNASRPIKAAEAERCTAQGIEFMEVPVAIDGVCIVVNPCNDFIDCMMVAELHTIWASEAEEWVTLRNQVRPEWPNGKFRLYGPGADSGTFDYFTEVINGEAQSSRGDFTASEDDNVLVQGVAGDKQSLGFFGYAYYAENQEKLKLVAVDGGGGCVTPNDETISNGSYAALSRPLFNYVRQDALSETHFTEFVRYHLGAEGQ